MSLSVVNVAGFHAFEINYNETSRPAEPGVHQVIQSGTFTRYCNLTHAIPLVWIVWHKAAQ